MLIQDYLDICDPVLTFDRLMGGIDLEKYLKNIQKHYTGRLRYNPVSMLKTVLFGFMTNGYISLRELEDQCRVNLRYMYLMEHEKPSYSVCPVCQSSMKKTKYDPSWVDEAEGLSAILDDDW